MNQQFKREHAALNIAACIFVIAIFAGWMLSGCQVAQQIGLLPTPTETPNVPATEAAQTADAQSSATAQAQDTATAQANASRTALAQQTAQAEEVQATRLSATASARSAATVAANSTRLAIDAYAEALAKTAKKAFGPEQGTRDMQGFGFISYTPSTYVRNFIIETRFSNPADGAIHPWDYGFNFRFQAERRGCAPGYRLIVDSDRIWVALFATGNNVTPTSCEIKTLSGGIADNLDISPTGSNLLRLIVNDKSAIVYINGQYQSIFDTSDVNETGNVAISAANRSAHLFPGLALRYRDFTIWSLP